MSTGYRSRGKCTHVMHLGDSSVSFCMRIQRAVQHYTLFSGIQSPSVKCVHPCALFVAAVAAVSPPV